MAADGLDLFVNSGPGDGSEGEEAFFQAVIKLSAAERAGYLAHVCGEDGARRRRIELLVEAHAEARFMAAPAGIMESETLIRGMPGEQPGDRIGHYRLLERLGAGGFGTVWRAAQEAPLRRQVALKILKLGMDTEEVVSRFEQERETLALMDHPHIARIFDAGATPAGRPFITMELLEGVKITHYCAGKCLDLRGRLELMVQVCHALQHAHQKGVVHRDLKPSNVLIVEEQGTVMAKVIDFGVAKATQVAEGEHSLFTRSGQVIGTPLYMSPEQAGLAGHEVDARADIYALGVLLYELLTGSTPIHASMLTEKGLDEVRRWIREEDPPRPSQRLRALAGTEATVTLGGRPSMLCGDLDWIVMKCLEKDRRRRYETAGALAADVERHLRDQPVLARPPSTFYTLQKTVRRHRTFFAAVAAVLVALLAGSIVSTWLAIRSIKAEREETRLRREATLTVADMYTRSGLKAAEDGDAARAALWFANAAHLAVDDPARVAANELRATTWGEGARTAVRAFDTGYEYLRELHWHPTRPALIVIGENVTSAQVWDLASESRWRPDMALLNAAWSPDGRHLAVVRREAGEDHTAVLEYPSGRERARLAGFAASSLRWSPDGRRLATGGVLWEWQTDARRNFPHLPGRVRFSADGELVLLQWGVFTTVCRVAEPETPLFPPVETLPHGMVEFLDGGTSFVHGRLEGGLAIYEARTGKILEEHPVDGNGPSAVRDLGMPLAVSADSRYIVREQLPLLDRGPAGAGRGPAREQKLPYSAELSTIARFSPDGAVLATGGYDCRLKLWRVGDGAFLGEAGSHHTAVLNLDFSPDGSLIASGQDGLVRVWRATVPDQVRRLPTGTATLAALSPDGKFLAASGFTNASACVESTRLFDIATGEPAGPELVPGGLLMDAVFGPGGDWLALAVSTSADRSHEALTAVGGGTGHLQFWNPRNGERLGAPVPLPSEPRGLALHPSGRWLGVGCAGGEGVEIDLATRAPRILFDQESSIHAHATLNNGRVGYSPDGRVFATWGFYDINQFWDREAGRGLIDPRSIPGNAFDVSFTGHVAARAFVANRMRLEFIDLRTGGEAAPPIPYTNWPLLARFSGDGRLLLTAGNARIAQLWDWRRGELVCPMLTHGDAVMAGVFLPGGSRIATGASDGEVKFWDARTGLQLRAPLRRPGSVLTLELTPDQRTLIACGYLDGAIELFDLAGLFPAANAELSPEDRLLLGEIDAHAEVHPGGGLAHLSPEAWLAKWRAFRQKHPGYAAECFRE